MADTTEKGIVTVKVRRTVVAGKPVDAAASVIARKT
jgi:hypothetical protein